MPAQTQDLRVARPARTPALIEKSLGLSRVQKHRLQMAADAVILSLSLAAAMALRLDSLDFLADGRFWRALAVFVPVSLLIFAKVGFYRAMVRFFTARSNETILAGVLASTAVLALTVALTGVPMPWTVLPIHFLLSLVLIVGLRHTMRRLLFRSSIRPRTRVIIYGAGVIGRQLQASLMDEPEYLPVAFVDDAPDLQGREIDGCTIHSPETLPRLVRSLDVGCLLLAMPSVGPAQRSRILRRLDGLPVQVRTVPGMVDLLSGRTRIGEIGDIPAEDLLGREPVQPDPDLMHHDIRDRVVMVTGAGGSIGSELCRQIVELGPRRLVLFELSEYNLYAIDRELQALAAQMPRPVQVVPVLGNIQNASRVAAALRDHGVQTIYHAAAYKHVPMVEDNAVEGVRNNVFGTRILAEAAVAAGVAAFILVSTDKAVRPTNVMGATKRMAELICQALAGAQETTRFSIVRFGNVLGSSGSVIPLFRSQIAAGGPITVTHPDVSRYFMSLPEAAQLLIQAGALSRGGDVFVLDMGTPVRIVDLALRMAQLSGLNAVVVPLGQTAPRPEIVGDIEIRFIGLRPGEKLHEELLIGNQARGTAHPRILTATEASLPLADLAVLLDRLKAFCDRQDIAALRALLSEATNGYLEGRLGADRQAAPSTRTRWWDGVAPPARAGSEASPRPLNLPKAARPPRDMGLRPDLH